MSLAHRRHCSQPSSKFLHCVWLQVNKLVNYKQTLPPLNTKQVWDWTQFTLLQLHCITLQCRRDCSQGQCTADLCTNLVHTWITEPCTCWELQLTQQSTVSCELHLSLSPDADPRNYIPPRCPPLANHESSPGTAQCPLRPGLLLNLPALQYTTL